MPNNVNREQNRNGPIVHVVNPFDDQNNLLAVALEPAGNFVEEGEQERIAPALQQAQEQWADNHLRHLENQIRRRGQERPNVIRINELDLPRGIVQQDPIPLPKRAQPVPKKAQPIRKKEYPPDGVLFRGRKFARFLSIKESYFYEDYGYNALIAEYPDLLYVEKEKPIDDKEECIILMSELADYYATEECKSTITNFNLEDHEKEYQIAYKKHIKIITKFKRNKHG